MQLPIAVAVAIAIAVAVAVTAATFATTASAANCQRATIYTIKQTMRMGNAGKLPYIDRARSWQSN